ncbi:MAG: hypothetical protein P4M12_04520 [Gammaproteobacteria bacterium]|nr:hypothetical protein [Gammaproteobacteria bacterium]
MLSHSDKKNSAQLLITHLNLGNICLEKNDLKLALNNFLLVLEIDDTNITALSALAKIYNKLALLEKQNDTPNLECAKGYTSEHTTYLKQAIEYARVQKKESAFHQLQYAHLIKTHFIEPTERKTSQSLPLPNKETLLILCEHMSNNLLLGWQYLKAEKYELAIHYLNESITEFPFDFFALTQRGIAYLVLKEDLKALSDLNAALSISNYSHAYHARAFIYLRTGQIQLAKQGFVECLKYSIEDCTEYFRLEQNLNDILKVLNDIPPQEDESLVPIQTCILAENKGPQEKIDDITNALKSDYKNPELYSERGRIYFQNKQYDLAVTDLIILIALQDENASFDSYALLRKSFIFLNNINAAFVTFDTSIRLYNDREKEISQEFSSELHTYGKKQLQEGNIQAAIVSFNLASSKNEKNTDIHLDLSFALFYYNNFTEALRHVQIVIDSDKNNKQAIQLYKKLQYACIMHEEEKPRQIILEQAPAIAFKPTLPKDEKPAAKPQETSVTKTKHTKKTNPNALHNKKYEEYNLLQKQKKEYAKLNAAAESPQIQKPEMPAVEGKTESITPISESISVPAIKTSQTKTVKKKNKKNKEKPVENNIPLKKPNYKPSEIHFTFFNSKPIANQAYTETPLAKIKITLPELARECLTLLKKSGHKSFVTGGMPRDCILANNRIIKFDDNNVPYTLPEMNLEKSHHLQGSDIDIITTQTPEEIERLLASLQVEKIKNVPGLYRIKQFNEITIDIFYNTKLQDSLLAAAQANDFIVNALFVDENFNVYDPTGSAIKDIMQGVLNTSISASLSFLKDPIRILRGIYLATKCQLTPSSTVLKQMEAKRILLMQNDAGKINVWLKKLFLHGHAEENYKKLLSLGIIASLFPTISLYMQKDEKRILAELKLTDQCKNPALYKIFQSFMFSASQDKSSTTNLIEKNSLIENEFNWQDSQAASFKYALR